jgi:putative Holliday junction resolvase
MQSYHRIMGIDFGTTRIGLSLSDPLQIIAQPYRTIRNDPRAIDAICDIIRQELVSLVVVGLPLNLKGEMGKKAREVEDFIGQLAAAAPAEIVSWDERFTTTMAHQTLLEMGTKRKDREQRRKRVDEMAASLILQSYLDSRKRSLSC